MSSAILGSYLVSLSVAFTVIFGYLFYLDRDKRKLMFMIIFVANIFAQLPKIVTGLNDLQIATNFSNWMALPAISAILIAALSSFFKQKDFKKSFRIFLLILVTSIFMTVLPVSVNHHFEILYPALSMVTIFVSFYLVLRRRELPDLMFLFSNICWALAELGSGLLGSGIVFAVFSFTCAHMFLALVFVTAKNSKVSSGIASFFALKKEFEKTQKELEISQHQLARAEDKFKSLVNVIAEPVVIVDHKGHFLEINDKIAELTGFSREELIGKNFLKTDIATKKSKAILVKNLAKRMIGIDVKPYEIEAKTKSGEILNVEVNAKKIEYEGKSADLVVFHDITERKMMEKKREEYAEQLEEEVKERTKTLRENEEKLRSIFNSSPDAIAVSDLKGNIIECNKATLDFLGLSTKDEIIGKNNLIFVAKKDQQKVRETMKNVLKMGPLTNIEYTALHKDGYEFPAEFSASAIKDHSGNPTGFVTMIEDITERKRREDELHKSETKNKAILNAIPDLMWRMNKDGVFLEFIPTKDFPTLIPPEQILGKNIHDVAPKWFAQKVMRYTKQAFQTKEVQIFEYQLPFKLGSDKMHDYETRLVVRSEDEILSIVRDITERKKAEERIRESEERYRSLVELAPDTIMTFDTKGVVTSVNTAAERTAGYSKDELVGKHFTKISPLRARDIPKYLKMLTSTARGKVPKPFEVCYRRKDGTTAFGEVRFSLIRKNGKLVGIQAIMRDITERKRMENDLKHYSEHLEELVEKRTRALKESQELLVKSERLAAIGQAATMVGHDLRNPLQAIENGAFYLNTELSNLPISKKTKETLEAMNQSIDYADRIVKDLQDFASKREPILRETDINAVVKETLSYIKTPKNVETSIEIDQLPKIMADKDMLKRILVNLAINGIQAMEEKGGKLIVSAKKTNGSVEVSFKDTGIGIKKENLRKIFTPFFTTKAQGMGVGLSVCKRFVELHGGSIKVESKEGEGSTFKVNLPIQSKGGGKLD